MFVKRFSTSNEVIKNCDASSTDVISLANECESAVVNSLQVKGFKIGPRDLAKLKLGVLYAAKIGLNWKLVSVRFMNFR